MPSRFANEAILPRKQEYRPSGLELLAIAATAILLIILLLVFHARVWAYALGALLVEFLFLLLRYHRSSSRR